MAVAGHDRRWKCSRLHVSSPPPPPLLSGAREPLLSRLPKPHSALSCRPFASPRPPSALQDIQPTWDNVVKLLEYSTGLARFSGPKLGWSDMDMLFGEHAGLGSVLGRGDAGRQPGGS